MISISKLGTFDYCEYIFPLQKRLKEEKAKLPKPSYKLTMGTQAHKEIHEKFKVQKQKEEEIYKETGIKPAIDMNREIRVKGIDLSGRIDQIEIGDSCIKIIDDKPTSTAHDGQKLQVWGYCLAYKEQENPTLPIYGAINDYNSNMIIWEEEFTEEKEKFVKEKVERLKGILDGTVEPVPTDNPYKCLSCRLFNKCDRKAI